MENQVTPISERRTALDLAFRVIASRKQFVTGYNEVSCNNEPNLVTIEKEGSALQGITVYLLNTNACTPTQLAAANKLLNQAVEAYAEGNQELAERLATDAINQSVVVRLSENADYVPSKGEVFAVYGELDAEGNVRAKANSAKPLQTKATRQVKLSSSLEEKLISMGILKAPAAKPEPKDEPKGSDDEDSPI